MPTSLRFPGRFSPRVWQVVGGVCLLIGLSLIWSGIWTYAAVRAVTEGNIAAASIRAQLAHPPVAAFSYLTLKKQPDVMAWNVSLGLLAEADDILAEVQVNLHQLTAPPENNHNPLQQLSEVLAHLESQVADLNNRLDQAWLVDRALTPDQHTQLDQAHLTLRQLNQLLPHFTEGSHTWLIVFQNTQELRATGGFMGSYALVTVANGRLQEVVIEDIYDADGQFPGYLAAANPVNRYLSENQGLRLPNANWSPEFPASSQNILQFFALGNKPAIEGVIAVNLEVLEDVLRVTGPLWLPDYQVEVTAETLSELTRSERSEFFPGSRQKKQILSHIWTQLKLQLPQLSPGQLQQLAHQLPVWATKKQIQFYSTRQPLQEKLAALGVTGQLKPQPATQNNCPTDYLYLVESNVGINKANHGIQRAVRYDLQDLTSTVSITFTNYNQPPTPEELAELTQNQTVSVAPHKAYVNYQRLLVPPTASVQTIEFAGQPVPEWDESVLTTSSGEQVKEIGFLVVIREGETKQASVTLATPYRFGSGQTPCQLVLQKQSGLPPVSYTITTPTSQNQLLLEHDTTVSLAPVVQ